MPNSSIQLKHSSCFLELINKNIWKLTLRFLLPKIVIPRSKLVISIDDKSKLRFDTRGIPVLEDLPQLNIVLSVSPSAEGMRSKILSTEIKDHKAVFKLPASINPIPGLLHRRVLSFSAEVYWLGGIPDNKIEISVALIRPFSDQPYTSDNTVGFDIDYYKTCPEIPPKGRFLFSYTGERTRPLIVTQTDALHEALLSLRALRIGVWGMADKYELVFWMSKEGAEYVARQIAFQKRINKTIEGNYKEKRIALVNIENRNNYEEKLFWREMTCQSISGIDVFAQPAELAKKFFAISCDFIAFERIGLDENSNVKWALHFEADKIGSITDQYEDLILSKEYGIIPWTQFIYGFSDFWNPEDISYIKSRVELIDNLSKRIIQEWNG